jgi:hypothetical protein
MIGFTDKGDDLLTLVKKNPELVSEYWRIPSADVCFSALGGSRLNDLKGLMAEIAISVGKMGQLEASMLGDMHPAANCAL